MRSWGLAALLGLQPVPIAAQGVAMVRGTVTDTSGQPVAFANIVFTQSGRRTASDDSGRFTVGLPGGRVHLRVFRIGYEPVDTLLVAERDTIVVIRMAPVPRYLERVTITESEVQSLRTTGFYDRMREAEKGINHGYFVTPEDLERMKPPWLTRMMYNLPGIRVVTRGPPINDTVLGLNGCRMTVYLDNVRIIGTLSGRDEKINDFVPAGHVAGMEIYPRAVTAPPRFQSLNGNCGVVVIWTK